MTGHQLDKYAELLRRLAVGRRAPQVALTPNPAEQRAIRTDAQRRLVELRRARDVLLPDVDDAAVMSELTIIDSEIRAAEQALRALRTAGTIIQAG